MRPPTYCPILLEGIVGSTAYGLATADSDIDKLGIFVQPTSDLWLLNKPRQTWNTDEGETDDYCYHEAEKYVSLALKCNPTILELLWLDHEYLTVQSTFGESLMDRRFEFLSKSYVRNAYLGYATQQLQRISRRNSPDFQNYSGESTARDNTAKDAKNARHLWRLVKQGVELFVTGTMDLHLGPYYAAQCRGFGESVAAGDIEWARREIAWAEMQFEKYEDSSPLPDKPNADSVETWLVNLRTRMLVPTQGLNF